MHNHELFSEVYGCYFTVIARILEKAKAGMTKAEIEDYVRENAFYDSAFHLLPKLFSNEWNLLEQNSDGRYYSKLLSESTERPLTNLEKSWIKALLNDKRISLFISPSEMSVLDNILADVSPLYLPEDFYITDSALDGDPYQDEDYVKNFRVIIEACKERRPLIIDYESGKQRRGRMTVLPVKLNYSSKDDKFRLQGILYRKGQLYQNVTLNLARIKSVQESDMSAKENLDIQKYLNNSTKSEPIVIEISTERNALERCMLQFASWEKQTEYDEAENRYICKIFYEEQDEPELMIRILSFGPVVRVLGPEHFLKKVKERVLKQYNLNMA